jgi:hypothetical protein
MRRQTIKYLSRPANLAWHVRDLMRAAFWLAVQLLLLWALTGFMHD